MEQSRPVPGFVASITRTAAFLWVGAVLFVLMVPWLARSLEWVNAQPAGTQMLLGIALTAAVGAAGFIAVRIWRLGVARWSPPSPPSWHDVKERFASVGGEVGAHRKTYRDGRREWALDGEARIRYWFKVEAARAGAMLIRQKRAHATDPLDAWLDALAAGVHPGTDITGSGRDEGGEYEVLFMERLVDASKILCAQLEAECRKK